MSKHLPRLAFRVMPANRFTIPVLLNQIEREGLDRYFKIFFLEDFAGTQKWVRENLKGLLIYSFMTPHLPEVQKEISWIKAQNKSRFKLLAGGPHTNGNPLSSLKLGFDYAYSGAAETGFSALLERYLQTDLAEVPTIYCSQNLSRLDGSMPLSKYFPTVPPLEITRGCYWNCKFCQTSSQQAIHRSFESIQQFYFRIREKNFNRRMGFICPSAFEYGGRGNWQANYERLQRLFSFCRENGTIYLEYGVFPSEARPNTFREEFVRLIGEFCSNKKITIGAQTGADRLLKALRRGHTVAEVEAACEMVHRHKLRPLVDIIFGLPGETNQDRHMTLRFIKELAVKYNARTHVHYFLPLSGTELENENPVPLDYYTQDLLSRYQRDGLCTGWWQMGRKLSRKLVEIRDQLAQIDLEYKIDHALLQDESR
ncbi:MAG: TIGR04013 family B12-binding domain/radical SAM domain-containing protein [Calditrichia bacterium]